jgi:hypothetical protein
MQCWFMTTVYEFCENALVFLYAFFFCLFSLGGGADSAKPAAVQPGRSKPATINRIGPRSPSAAFENARDIYQLQA